MLVLYGTDRTHNAKEVKKMKWYQLEDNRQMHVKENAVGDLGIDEGFVASGKVDANDLREAAAWLATYCAQDLDEDHKQDLFNTYVWLIEEAERRDHRKAVNNAKRAYAKANGISFRNVRYSAKAGA